MFCISCSPTGDFLRFSIMRAGKVTQALHQLEAGDKITVRGPLGNSFPMEDWKGKHIITIGGGVGQAPLRPIVEYVRANIEDYASLTAICGARTSGDICFKSEFAAMKDEDKVCCHLSVDVEEEDGPNMLVSVLPVDGSKSITGKCNCDYLWPADHDPGLFGELKELGFEDDTDLIPPENRMKCGIGKCGRCNAGPLYVCKDGPVFTYATLKEVPESFA